MRVDPYMRAGVAHLLLALVLAGLFAPLREARAEEWQALSSGTSQSLRGVHFPVDPATGWVVGVTGTILKTTDGGLSWTTQITPTLSALEEVYFRDNSTGWAVGMSGWILSPCSSIA